MSQASLARVTRAERAFFALSVAVFAWALYQRFGLRDTSTAASSFVVLTAVMALSGAASLFRLRAVRYMGALVATRHNPQRKDSYLRLRAAGTPKQVALTACMRKLLTILTAILRHGLPWRRPALPHGA